MINLTLTEKYLISSAILWEKRSAEYIDPMHMEFINDIEEDIKKEIILLSRTQIDVIVYYLETLLDTTEYDPKEISALQLKLNLISDLP